MKRQQTIPTYHRSQCGFSMTELAIVMAIVGLILAGIWTAAGHVMETSDQRQLTNDLQILVSNTRAFYSGQMGIGKSTDMIGNLWIEQTLYNSNALPGTMLRNPAGACAAPGGICIEGPWGTQSSVRAKSYGSLIICPWKSPQTVCTTALSAVGAAGPFQTFAVELSGVTVKSCIQAAAEDSGTKAPPGLVDVVINGTSMKGLAPLPIDPMNAQAPCTAASPITVDFVFRVNPGNF